MASTEIPPCPIPQLTDALHPYLHPRHTTHHIRRLLTAHLAATLRDTDPSAAPTSLAPSPSPLSHLLLACPPASLDLPSPDIPPEFSALRARYLAALSANAAARRRWAALRGECVEIRGQHDRERRARGERAGSVSGSGGAPTTATGDARLRTYVTLVERRKRKAALEACVAAAKRLETLCGENGAVGEVKRVVRERIGEAPEMTRTVEGGEMEGRVGEMVYRVKREVLEARRQVEEWEGRVEGARRVVEERGGADLQGTVWALGRARDELIGWIEEELARVPEVDAEGDEPVDGADAGRTDEEPVPSTEQIDAAYERYLESRRALLETMAALPPLDRPTEPQPSARTTSQLPATTTTTTTKPAPLQSHHILPQLPALLRCVEDERDLMLQTAHLRRRLAAGAEEYAKTIDRLAAESHLLQDADITDVSLASWATASAAQRAELERFLEENMQTGDTGLRKAEEVLQRIEAKKVAWRELKCDL